MKKLINLTNTERYKHFYSNKVGRRKRLELANNSHGLIKFSRSTCVFIMWLRMGYNLRCNKDNNEKNFNAIGVHVLKHCPK